MVMFPNADRWIEMLDRIMRHPRYQAGILYGEPRRGHDEGAIGAHIDQLIENLDILQNNSSVTAENYAKLAVLAHVHDTFKGETAAFNKKNCAIEDPQSHASLARAFLAEFTDDQDMLEIVQYHDLGYALYRNIESTGRLNERRMQDGLDKIKDLNLFLLFCIIDTCTPSKGRTMIHWWIEKVREHAPDKVWVTTEFLSLFPAPTATGVF